MSLSRTVARPLLASIFLVGPIYALRNSSGTAKKAEPVTDPLVQLAQRAGIPLPKDPETLVKINAGVQITAGLCLATGRFPRLASAVLATSLVPTTVAGHAFWNETDPDARRAQQLQLAKNLSLLGALIIAAGDTDGKPGVAWMAKHAAGDAKLRLGHAATTAKLEGKVAALEAEVGAGTLGASVGSALLAAGQHAKEAIKDAAHQAATSDTTQNLAERAGDLASNLADTAREKGPVVAARASALASNLADTAKERGPVVAAAARDHAASFAETAREEAGPIVAQWSDQARSTSKELKKQAQANAKDLRKQAKKAAKDARKQAAPVVKDLRKQAEKKAKKARKQAGKKGPAAAAAARHQAAALGEAAKAKLA